MQNALFSPVDPNLQIIYDATSLRALMFCPRSYQYAIKDGYRGPRGVDLEFGGFFADCAETYKLARMAGKDKLAATIEATRRAMEITWLDDDNGGRPWGGHYVVQWRCTGSEPYKNAKGNRAKCPWSHKGEWFPVPAPDVCGVCHSPIQEETHWIADDNAKDRDGLIRAVVWWCDEQPEDAESGAMPFIFPNGEPAAELALPVPLPWTAPTGERYVLVAKLDAIDQFGKELFITDQKTTKKTLNHQYWRQYSPNVQVDTYDLVGDIALNALNIRGVRIDAVQALVEGARFGAQVFYRDEAQREEYLEDLRYWLDQAERFAKDNRWPMNRANCAICQFQKVCSKSPAQREAFLKANFEVRFWNPMEEVK